MPCGWHTGQASAGSGLDRTSVRTDGGIPRQPQAVYFPARGQGAEFAAFLGKVLVDAGLLFSNPLPAMLPASTLCQPDCRLLLLPNLVHATRGDRGANLTGADLRGADLTGARLDNAILDRAI